MPIPTGLLDQLCSRFTTQIESGVGDEDMLFPLSDKSVPRVSSRNDETPTHCIRTALVVKIGQIRRNKVDHLIRKMCSQLELHVSLVEDLFDLPARCIPIC